MPNRTRIDTGTPWEKIVGYSRAVRVGEHVYVSGTTASDEQGKVIGIGDPAAQTEYIIRKVERALVACGAALADVVRVRMYVTDIAQWEAVGRKHGEFFGEIRPVTTMVEVSKLIDPDHLVEIEVEAIVGSGV